MPMTTLPDPLPSSQVSPVGPVDPDDADRLPQWLDHFGITVEQLRESVNAAGSDPQAVAEHLLHQGGSAGPG